MNIRYRNPFILRNEYARNLATHPLFLNPIDEVLLIRVFSVTNDKGLESISSF
jgi:hypothetical protein